MVIIGIKIFLVGIHALALFMLFWAENQTEKQKI